MGQLIAAAAYSGGQRVADISIGEGRRWAQKSSHFVWIGFHEPNESELREIQAQFELHPLAIEDALHAHQRPKLELYGDSLFLVLRTAQLQGDHVAFGETHIFAGRASSSRSATALRRPMRPCAPAVNPASAPASRGGLRTLRHPRFRGRQLPAGHRGDGKRSGRARGPCAQGPDRPGRRRADLSAAPRAPPTAPHSSAPQLRCVAGSSISSCRSSTTPSGTIFATSWITCSA